MRVKLDEENQQIIQCPDKITKIKIVTQSEQQEDGSFKDSAIPIPYDITGYHNSQESLDDGYEDIDDNLIALFRQQKAKIKNKRIVDITYTAEYKTQIAKQDIEVQKANLTNQINDLDIKRIRAICEPSVKDKSMGQTWLEYYTEQIKTLRVQLNSLN